MLTIRGTAQQIGSAQAAVTLNWDGGTQQSAQLAIAVTPPSGALQFALPVTKLASAGAPAAIALSGPNLFLLTSSVEVYQNQPTQQARVNLIAQPSIALPSGSVPDALVALDLNGDQRTDLIVLDNAAGAITTYLAGDSGYAAAQTFPVNTNATAMATLNLSGAANSGLVVIGDDGVALFTANGDGTFTPAVTFDLVGRQSKLLAVAAGSFTGAGLDDLVLSDAAGNIWLLPSDGAGGFGVPTVAQAGTNPIALAIGDFNGDGNLDVAVANSGSASVSLLLGDGAGNLGAAANFAVGAGPQALAAADFNGDGKLDLAVAVSGANTVALLRGDGAGGLGAPFQYPVGTGPAAIAVGDIDGDGKPDIAVVNRQSRDFSILLNQD